MEETPYLPLLLITALAVVVPLLANRLSQIKIPIVVGEILAGMIVGRSGFDLVQGSPILDFLAEFGFAMLMFLSGLEIDFSLLVGTSNSKRGPGSAWGQPLPLALLMLALTSLLAYLGALGLSAFDIVDNPLLVALILSTTSLGVVLPVLKERHAITTRFGQYLLVAASIADFLTLILLTVVMAAATRGLGLDLLLILVLLAVFALLTRVAPFFAATPVLRKIADELSHATAQIRVRGAVALLVALVVLAEALGVEVILGAFLAGAVVGLMARQEECLVRDKLDAIGFGFFIPVFFVMVGVNFDLPGLLSSKQSILLIPAFLVLAYVAKFVPALLFRTTFTWRQTLAAGSLLSARLSLIIAVSSIALKMGTIDAAMNASFVLVAAITCTLSPLLFNLIYPQVEAPIREGVIVAGTGHLATLLAKRLRFHGRKVVTVFDNKKAARASHAALEEPPAEPEWDPHAARARVVFGPPGDENTWQRAGAQKAKSLIVLHSDPEVTLGICELARERFHIPLVVAPVQTRLIGDHTRLSDGDLIKRLRALGVKIVQPAVAMAVAIEAAVCFPMAFEVMVNHDDNVELGEAILENTASSGMPLRKLKLSGNALIFSIHRDDGTVVVPSGDTVLRQGDRVSLIGNPESIEGTIDILSASNAHA